MGIFAIPWVEERALQCAYMMLGGTTRGLIAVVEQVQAAVGRTPIGSKLAEEFAHTFHRLRKQCAHREAAIRQAEADDARCRAIALDVAHEQVTHTFSETIMHLRVQRLLEKTRDEYHDACDAAAQTAETQGETVGSVVEALRDEALIEAHNAENAQIDREHAEIAAPSALGDDASLGGRSD